MADKFIRQAENIVISTGSLVQGDTPVSGPVPDVSFALSGPHVVQTVDGEEIKTFIGPQVTITSTWTEELEGYGGVWGDEILGITTEAPVRVNSTTYTEIVNLPDNIVGKFNFAVFSFSHKSKTTGRFGPPENRLDSINYDTRIPDVHLRYDGPAIVKSESVSVNAEWNISVAHESPDPNPDMVNPFTIDDLTAVWQDEQGLEGKIVNFSGSEDEYSFDVELPESGKGVVSIVCSSLAASSIINPSKKGPPIVRQVQIQYDNIEGGRPAKPPAVNISIPPNDPHKLNVYVTDFIWATPVTNWDPLDDDDVEVTGAAKGNVIPTPDDDNLYKLEIVISGTGTGKVKVKVPAESASAGGLPGPESDTEVEWNYAISDPTTAIQTPGAISSEVLYTETKDINDLDGSFLGISDLKIIGDRVYGMSQIQKKEPYSDNAASYKLQSRGELFSIPLAGGQLQSHKTYELFLAGARSIQEFDSEPHYFEGSHYAYLFIPTTGSLQAWLDLLGNIGKITNGIATSIGPNWQSKEPTGYEDRNIGIHGGTASPMIAADNNLNMISLYGNTDVIGFTTSRAENEVFDIDNFQWIRYGKTVHPRIPLFETNDRTAWNAIEEIAAIANCFIGFESGVFNFRSRIPTYATVSGSFGNADKSVTYKDAIRAFPQTGIIAIGSEAMSYESNTSNVFGGLVRETPSAHTDEETIYLIDHIIDSWHVTQPVNDADIKLLPNSLYNVVNLNFARGEFPRQDGLTIKSVDAESIALYKKRRTLKLDMNLTKHQRDVAILLASQYLRRYKNLPYMIPLTLRFNKDYRVGQIVFIRIPKISHVAQTAQIMSIKHSRDRDETIIECFTLE